MITALTHTRFLRYQELFRLSVQKAPISIDLLITSMTTVGGFTDFTGDSARSEKTYRVKALYRRDFSTNDRIKYGIPDEVSGIVYVAPRELIDTMGTFKLNRFKTKVRLHDIVYVVENVIYKAPFYNSCISVEIRLKDITKA